MMPVAGGWIIVVNDCTALWREAGVLGEVASFRRPRCSTVTTKLSVAGKEFVELLLLSVERRVVWEVLCSVV